VTPGLRRAVLGVTVLTVLQGAAVLIYRGVERSRDEAARPFGSEQLSTRERAPSLEVERTPGSGSLQVPGAPGKVVLVPFWATWCAPCREELPGLLAMSDKLRGSGFALYAVSVDGDWSTVEDYFKGQVPETVVRARDAEAHRRYGVSTLPDTYLVDREGRLAERFGGARDWRSSAAEKHIREKIDE
jgi:thiol-disulfide isomerase/thioredoxin